MQSPSRNAQSIVNRVRPCLEGLLATDLRDNPAALAREAVRANVRASASHLPHGSQLIEELSRNQGLLIVRAQYPIETGIVDFFDGVPA